MSGGIMAYATNTYNIEQLFGSNKVAVLRKVLRAGWVKDRVDALDADGGPPMRQIADDFLRGRARFAEHGDRYWYWVEILCRHFGSVLPNGAWYPRPGATLLFDGCAAFRLYGLAIELPLPAALPSVYVVDNQDLLAAYQAIYKSHQRGEIEREANGQLYRWTVEAKPNRGSLVLFYY